MVLLSMVNYYDTKAEARSLQGVLEGMNINPQATFERASIKGRYNCEFKQHSESAKHTGRPQLSPEMQAAIEHFYKRNPEKLRKPKTNEEIVG